MCAGVLGRRRLLRWQHDDRRGLHTDDRRFIGCEKDVGIFRKGVERVKREVYRAPLFQPALAQGSLLQ